MHRVTDRVRDRVTDRVRDRVRDRERFFFVRLIRHVLLLVALLGKIIEP